jgi:hypothetical protein
VAVLFTGFSSTMDAISGSIRRDLAQAMDESTPGALDATNPVSSLMGEVSEADEQPTPEANTNWTASITKAVVVSNCEPYSDAAWAEARKELKLQGVRASSNGTYVAMLRGVAVGENKRVALEFQGHRYEWLVMDVTEKGVQIRPMKK